MRYLVLSLLATLLVPYFAEAQAVTAAQLQSPKWVTVSDLSKRIKKLNLERCQFRLVMNAKVNEHEDKRFLPSTHTWKQKESYGDSTTESLVLYFSFLFDHMLVDTGAITESEFAKLYSNDRSASYELFVGLPYINGDKMSYGGGLVLQDNEGQIVYPKGEAFTLQELCN